MITLAVVNLKGGTGKTTSAAFVAHALAEASLSVLVVDADPQGSCQRWAEQAGWQIPVIGMAVRTLHTQLPGVGAPYDVVVIDTPPLEEQRGVVMSALRAADVVVVPVAPTPVEVDRLPAVRSALVDAADLRLDGTSPAAAVLLTRTVAQAASTAAWREHLVSDGWTVLGVEIRRLERYAQAFGDRVDAAADGAYGAAASELLDLVKTGETEAGR